MGKKNWITAVVMVLLLGRADVSAALPKPAFKLHDPGKEAVVDYEKYGEFQNAGTDKFRYRIKDSKGLAAAVGQGIFPNTRSMQADPEFKRFQKEKRLEGSHWLYIDSTEYQANFYRWSIAEEDPGVKMFYTGMALENAGHIMHAIKAYYAVVINFPKTIGWTYWKTPWYISPAALDRIHFLTRKYPQLGLRLEGASVIVENRYDNDIRNDSFIVTPGKFVKCDPREVIDKPLDLSKLKVKVKKEFGNIHLVQYENKHWQMLVDGKPFMARALAYQPSKTGQSPDLGTIEDWTCMDYNENGKIDSPFDAWVDKNRNNIQDEDEPAVGDFRIMKDMGANTIRVYHHDFAKNKEVFRQLYEQYGIRVIMGDYLGMYAVGSKAPWIPGTDYSDAQQQKNMLESVMKMVDDYKDEPCLLMWILGNENNYGTANNSPQDPQAYYRFVNEAAKMIKEADPNHPVAICNGDLLFLDHFARECPDVDIYGTNAYRGKLGFGDNSFWVPIRGLTDKPVLVTEYGCPAYGHNMSREYAENYQAEYVVGNWLDINNNRAGRGIGNSIGGVLFEYVDEWWKAGAPPGYPDIIQDITPNFSGPFVDGWSYEEWFGIVSQGDGTDSPFMRHLRPAYFELQKLWKETEE